MSAAGALVAAAAAVWAAAAGWLTVIDLRTRTLPTRIIWPAAGAVWLLLSCASLIVGEPHGLIGALAGAAAASAPVLAVHLIHPPSMGFGDVRFSVLNGLLCGWWGWEVALFALAAAFIAAVPEALYALIRHGPRTSRPLGPYLALGAAASAAWAAASRGVVPFG